MCFYPGYQRSREFLLILAFIILLNSLVRRPVSLREGIGDSAFTSKNFLLGKKGLDWVLECYIKTGRLPLRGNAQERAPFHSSNIFDKYY